MAPGLRRARRGTWATLVTADSDWLQRLDRGGGIEALEVIGA
ncbi:MAG: hypothetical protein ABI131_10460 [Nostocoides sp.]